ncbi:hypothetical protein L1987_66722 [Smallanthus sonchifolius]|uniref:Uncharacterized protein n=1 Tax=Smallanthus sonchifolius TaxID=185202 RepID=A0ACB9BY96_9ASTR|nr:hypothetical protein L1987_66722 [Smallanthus sonchifolius]
MVLPPLQIAITAQRNEQPPPSSDPSPAMAPLITAQEAAPAGFEMNLLQAMCTVNFWLLFLAMVCALGSGLATINNITQIGESLDYSTVEINAMISLWSIRNFLIRFGGGFVSDFYLHRYGWGRPLFISFTQLGMIIGHLIIGSSGNLYLGSVIVGVCYGSQWSLMPTITSEIFGVKHMGTIFNTIATANPIGSYILSVQVIGNIYDKQAEARGGSCRGIRCFMLSLFSPHSPLDRKMAVKNKWMSTVASIWIQCTSGSLYTFSFYSPALKASQGYDQSTLDTVSVFKDFGANSGVLSGLLYTAVASPSSSITFRGRRGGPWIVLLIGAIQCFLGYFLMWLSVTGTINRPPVPVMCVFMLLAAHGVTFLNTANVVTAVINFPNHSGTIVGIMKGFLGLSGAILLQVYQTVFNTGPTHYILMLSLLPFLNTLLFMSSVRPYETNEVDEKRNLNGLSLCSIIVAAYLFTIIILEQAV